VRRAGSLPSAQRRLRSTPRNANEYQAAVGLEAWPKLEVPRSLAAQAAPILLAPCCRVGKERASGRTRAASFASSRLGVRARKTMASLIATGLIGLAQGFLRRTQTSRMSLLLEL
jgi:hypothetical protein